jgi:hypothetical protein
VVDHVRTIVNTKGLFHAGAPGPGESVSQRCRESPSSNQRCGGQVGLGAGTAWITCFAYGVTAPEMNGATVARWEKSFTVCLRRGVGRIGAITLAQALEVL